MVEPEKERIRGIASATVFEDPGMNSAFRPSELLMRREQKRRDKPRSARLNEHAFLVQLLADILSARLSRTG